MLKHHRCFLQSYKYKTQTLQLQKQSFQTNSIAKDKNLTGATRKPQQNRLPEDGSMEKLSFDGHILIHLRARVKGVCEASVRLSPAAPHIAVCTLPDPASLSSFFLTDGPVQKAMEATPQKTPNGKLGESQAPCTRVELFTVAFISLSLMRKRFRNACLSLIQPLSLPEKLSSTQINIGGQGLVKKGAGPMSGNSNYITIWLVFSVMCGQSYAIQTEVST